MGDWGGIRGWGDGVKAHWLFTMQVMHPQRAARLLKSAAWRSSAWHGLRQYSGPCHRALLKNDKYLVILRDRQVRWMTDMTGGMLGCVCVCVGGKQTLLLFFLSLPHLLTPYLFFFKTGVWNIWTEKSAYDLFWFVLSLWLAPVYSEQQSLIFRHSLEGIFRSFPLPPCTPYHHHHHYLSFCPNKLRPPFTLVMKNMKIGCHVTTMHLRSILLVKRDNVNLI